MDHIQPCGRRPDTAVDSPFLLSECLAGGCEGGGGGGASGGGRLAPRCSAVSRVLGCRFGLAGGWRPDEWGGGWGLEWSPFSRLSLLAPTEWQDCERGAMAEEQGRGERSCEAGMVMKPIRKCRRKDARSRTFPTVAELSLLPELEVDREKGETRGWI